MATVRELILKRTKEELLNIKTVNGYSTNIKNTYYGFTTTVNQYPSISIAFGTDVEKSPLASVEQDESVDLYIWGYLEGTKQENGNLTFAVERFYSDLRKFFSRNKKIAPGCSSTLKQIYGIYEFRLVELGGFVEIENDNKCVVNALVKIFYLVDSDDDENEDVSAMGDSAQI
jgi:hypothetical protein